MANSDSTPKTKVTRKVTTTTTTRKMTSSKSSSDEKAASSATLTTKGFFRYTAVVLALTAALGFNLIKEIVTDTGVLLGPIQPFNTAGCEVVKGLEGCEDVHIHHSSGLAFTACGHAEARKGWYPPIGKNNPSTENAFQDEFVVYDIVTGEYQVMELTGLPQDTDRVFHGLDIYERSATELTIFAVNHRRTGSVIEVLEYTLGDKTVQYKETIQHELIHTPNDIVALGPRSFYVSNDHRHSTGMMRHIEENLRRPWSNVIYYSPDDTFVAYEGAVSANGMTANQDRTTIYLSACHGGAMHVLIPHEDHRLVQQDYIKLDYYNDNPSFDAETGAVFITGHVKPLTMVHGLGIPEKPVNGPSKVVKIYKNPVAETMPGSPKYLVDTVLLDDGHLISTGTTAAVDRKRGVMLIGTVFSDRGLVRCPIPEGV